MHGKENSNPNASIFRGHFSLNDVKSGENIQANINLCPLHKEEIGKYFCEECLCYSICSKCIESHKGHTIQKFKSIGKAKEQTKEVLLIEVDKTLNRLKGRQNQLKNQIEEISLIKDRLQSISNEVITSIKHQIQQLEKRIREKLEHEFDRYEKEVDSFYREYNLVNDFLREHLLQIIDGEINVLTFSRQNICRDIDVKWMPQFGKIKQIMQKCKKYLKNVKQSTKQLQNSIKFFSNEDEKSQSKYEKYDRFLKQKNGGQQHNSSLMRTLNILDNYQPDLSVIKYKLMH